jgi:nicotinamide riboside kinase
MTKIVNFYGGPSAGKSTMAASLFGWMKQRRLNVEYVSEFAKDLTWQRRHDCLDDQVFIVGEQHHRIYTLLGQTDWVITDSPLLLQVHYAKQACRKYHDNPKYQEWVIWFEDYIWRTYDLHYNIDFLVQRGDRQFIQAGRVQTESEAKEIDGEMQKILDRYRRQYATVNSLQGVLEALSVREDLTIG